MNSRATTAIVGVTGAILLLGIFVVATLNSLGSVKGTSKATAHTNHATSSEFNEIHTMAAKHCTSATDTDPRCLEYFQSLQNRSPEQKAQENTGVTGESTLAQSISPVAFLTTWNFNNLSSEERQKYYKETRRPDGSVLREYWIFAEDRDIEVAPGIIYPAWTYNGQVPAPTIRATEGDLVRIHFTNKGTKAHTIHSHGFHPANMDGSMPEDFVYPGQTFTYEFVAEPAGLHLYHCHSSPLKQHIAKGLYGAYIVDPKLDTRPRPSQELVMVMNGFDTDGDGENEVYAVNTEAFYYAKNPIKVKKGELVRIFLINIVENDPVNSIHLHGNFFDEYRTGTKQVPNAFTDITSFVQGERAILDVRFKFTGMYMFHAHQSEFTEKGWMGFFEVVE